MSNPKTSVEFLTTVSKIQEERGAEYNQEGSKPERSFARVATAFNAITQKDLTGSEVALLLQILKDVRQWTNPTEIHIDSLIDSISYASLKAECLVEEVATRDSKKVSLSTTAAKIRQEFHNAHK